MCFTLVYSTQKGYFWYILHRRGIFYTEGVYSTQKGYFFEKFDNDTIILRDMGGGGGGEGGGG